MDAVPISPDAVRLLHEATESIKKGDGHHAYQLLLASVANDPNIIGSWNNIGSLLHQWKRYPAAGVAFYRALQLAPTMSAPLLNYAWNLHLTGRSAEALPLLREVCDREDATALAYTNLSQIYLAIDEVTPALKAAAKAVELGPNEAMPHLALALALLRMGDYATGLAEYESRMPYVPELAQILKYPYQRMTPHSDIKGQRVFVVGEQGLGDSVQFLRFIPELHKRGAKVIVHVHSPCARFFRANLDPEIEVIPLPHELPAADFFVPMLSLPVVLGLSNKDIRKAYYEMKAPAECPYPFHDNGMKRIGICWRGDLRHDNDQWRSMNINDMLSLGELPNTQLFGLQIGTHRADLDTVGANGLITDLNPYIRDISDTTAIVKQLDYVVTVDTALAHVAGAVGCKVKLLMPRRGLDWRWQEGEGPTFWYPNTTMIRQKVMNDWPEVMQRLRLELQAEFSAADGVGFLSPPSSSSEPDLEPHLGHLD